MVFLIKKILEDMGWAEGTRIPVANKENLELQEELERLTVSKAKALINLQGITSKCSALEKHLKNVKAEQEANQNLLLARQSELYAEKDMHILAKMNKKQLNGEIKTFIKNLEKAETRKDSKLKELNKLVEKLDRIKASIEWDEQIIDDWDKLLLKTDEGNDLIKKYSEEDKKKIKDLEVKRLRLQEEEIARRQLVVTTSKELESLELIVNRNVQLYKQLHEERSALLKQWQEAVKNLQQRDKDTLSINKEIIHTKELIETKIELLDREKLFYENEVNNNAELELIISEANSEVERLRKDLNQTHDILNEINIMFEHAKRDLKKTAALLENERTLVRKMQEEVVERNKILTQFILKVQQLKVQEKHVRESQMSSTERVKALEDLIHNEEIIHKGLLMDLENVQNLIFRSQKSLNELIEFNKLKVLEIQSCQQGLELIERQKQHVDKVLLQQKEQNYKANFKLAMLLSKLTRLTGEEIEEDETLEKKLTELQEKSKETIELSNLLQTQINRLEDIMRYLTNVISGDSKKLQDLKDRLQDQVLLSEGGKKQLETKKHLYFQNQVDENVMKVKLRYIENALKAEGNTIYNLQRQYLELDTATRERETEIKINKDILLAKKMTIKEDNSRLRMDIQGRRLKIETLKKRLDAILMSLGRTEDGKILSVAYFKVKNAQEKFFLQEVGDKLDDQIRKAEKEIVAMENTLKAVNCSNESYKKNLGIVEGEDEDTQTIKMMENEIHATTKLIRLCSSQFDEQQKKLFQIKQELEKKYENIKELESQIKEKTFNLDQLQNEAYHRHIKMERADQQINKLLARQKINEVQKRDFQTYRLKEFNKSALQDLKELAAKYEELQEVINNYFLEKNISVSSTSLQSSSRSCSSRSYNTTPSRCSMHSVTLTLDIP